MSVRDKRDMDGGEHTSAFKIGDFTVSPDELTVSNESGQHTLESKVMDVLLVLVAEQGDVVSREDLIDRVWGTEFGGDESLSRAISLLRKALGDTRGNHQHIRTIPRKGYQLIAPVGGLESESAGQSGTAKRSPENSSELHSPLLSNKPKFEQPASISAPRTTRTSILAAAVGALLVVAGWVFWPRSGSDTDVETVTAEIVFPIDTFSISALETIGESAHLDTLARTLPDELARGFAKQTLNATKSGNTLGTSLDTEFVIGGTLQESDTSASVTLDVLDNHSGAIIWSKKIERPSGEYELLSKQLVTEFTNIAYCFVSQRKRYEPFERLKQTTLLFRICEASTGDGEEFGSLPKLSAELLNLSPDDPEAIAGLAISEAFVSVTMPPSAELDRLRSRVYENVDKVLQLQPNNGGALWAKAVVNDPSVSILEREQYLHQAYEHDPGFQWSRNHLGHLYVGTGQLQKSLFFYRKLIEDFPTDFRRATWVAQSQARVGRIDFARKQMADLARDYPHSQNHITNNAITMEMYLGDPERAKLLAQTIFMPPDLAACVEMTMNAKLNQNTLTAEAIDEACRKDTFVFLSRILTMFGHIDEAFNVLDEHANFLNATHFNQLRGLLFEPDMAPIRSDPRFIPFTAKIGLVEYWAESGTLPDFCQTEDVPYDCQTVIAAEYQKLSREGE